MKLKLLQLTKVAVMATFLFATLLTVLPANALDCKDVNVIFMRGSSQNYEPHNSEDINFPVWEKTADKGIQFTDYRYDKTNDKEPAFVTTEKESLKYFKSIGDRVIKDFPKLSLQFVSLHDIQGKYSANGYKAVSAFGPWNQGFVSRNAIDAKFGNIDEGVYRQSVADGAEELAGYLQDQMVSCPSQLNIVGGFSQGAQVVGEAMVKMHERGQDQLLSRLGHVDMYGDPKFNGYELVTSRLNPVQKHVTMPWARGTALQQYAGSLGPRKPYVPDILTSKTASWCDFKDIVCGGIIGAQVDYDAHGQVYSMDKGHIEASANEIYVDIKQRLGLLAGLTDKSANSPLAYWNGIENPEKLDIKFVIDRTGDETISLIPDPDYISNNIKFLGSEGYSSVRAGVTTYTEFSRFDGTKDVIESVVKTPVQLTSDIHGDYSHFKSEWGKAHFQNPPYGGDDLRDSPFSALESAIKDTTEPWRTDARKVIVVFSNSWGKDTEDTTNLTAKKIITSAKAKKVEILPVFTSKTLRSDAASVNFVNDANIFWTNLAKNTKGHHTEITNSIYDTLVRDVVMNHVFAPDPVIEMGKDYAVPKAKASTKNQAAPKSIKTTKPVVKKAKKVVLSAAKSTSANSKITKYNWDVNGDGTTDVSTDQPDIEHVFEEEFDGEICLEAIAADGAATTACQDFGVSDDDDDITHEDPENVDAPQVASSRIGASVELRWTPTDGKMYFYYADGTVMAEVNAQTGVFTITDAPQTGFEVKYRYGLGVSVSDMISLQIPAAETTQEDIVGDTGGTNSGGVSNGTNEGSGGPGIAENEPLQPARGIVLGDVIKTNGAPLQNKTTSIKESDGASASTQSTSAKLVDAAKNLIATVKLNGGFGLNWMLLLAGVFWSNQLLLLLLLALLVLLLLLSMRDRKESKYEHNRRYVYNQRLLKI